jgi:preprotein translocase subunit SecB
VSEEEEEVLARVLLYYCPQIKNPYWSLLLNVATRQANMKKLPDAR